MRKVSYSMGVSLDGYIAGADGSFDWGTPGDDLFRFYIDELREIGVHLLGRQLYETMLYWEDPDEAATFDDAEKEWADLWNPLPKVVFSSTLTTVGSSARLASGSVADEIERLRAEPAYGDIAIGGATLAVQAAELGLIDEYQITVWPVLVGGGTRFFAHDNRTVKLALIENRTFDAGAIFLRYRVIR